MDNNTEKVDWQKAKQLLAKMLETLGPLLVTALVTMLLAETEK